MHLGIIKIIYNRTAQPRCYHNAFYGWRFREPRRGGNSDFALTIWHFWISDCFVISLSICYWLLKCGVLRVVCVCRARVCVREIERETGSHHSTPAILIAACVCVWERERERETGSHHSGVSCLNRCLNSCVYHRLYFTHNLKNPIIKPHRKISKEPAANYSSGFWRHSSPTLFRRVLVVFSQSQCTVPVGQSEQTALVGRRDFVENEVFERGRA